MERFSEITARCAAFMIDALNEAFRSKLGDGNDGSTAFVKNAQAIQLGKVVTAIGIFSIFEAKLQDGLNCGDGFTELRRLLSEANEQDLAFRFDCFMAAVNVLKHGKGRSYEWLLTRHEPLPFVIKAKDQHFFFEGDVSEPDTLVLVDDAFIHSCAKSIEILITFVQSVRPTTYFC